MKKMGGKHTLRTRNRISRLMRGVKEGEKSKNSSSTSVLSSVTYKKNTLFVPKLLWLSYQVSFIRSTRVSSFIPFFRFLFSFFYHSKCYIQLRFQFLAASRRFTVISQGVSNVSSVCARFRVSNVCNGFNKQTKSAATCKGICCMNKKRRKEKL